MPEQDPFSQYPNPTEPADPTAEPVVEPLPVEEADKMGTGLFVLIAIALAAIVGAGVYVAGQARDRAQETADAQDRSDQIIDDTNVDFDDLFDDPDPLPFGDDDPTTTTTPATNPPASTEAPPTTEPSELGEDGLHPGVDVDPESIAIVFVNRAPGEDYGKVGYISFLGERIITELRCSRIDLNAARGLCLTPPHEFLLSGRGLILEPDLVPSSFFNLNSPSRAVVSPDGSIVGWTGFTSGHSYAEVGEFSTITQLIAVDRQLGVNLETDFNTVVEGQESDAVDRNFWGVTFADNDTFYATLQTGDDVYIVEGSLATSQIRTRFADASCPEISPDGRTIVAKEMRGDSFQLVAIDVETGDRRDLGETRSVDDQVEWLDDTTIVYALPNDDEGTGAQPAFDVWALDVTPGSTPQLIIPFAESPAVK